MVSSREGLSTEIVYKGTFMQHRKGRVTINLSCHALLFSVNSMNGTRHPCMYVVKEKIERTVIEDSSLRKNANVTLIILRCEIRFNQCSVTPFQISL